MTPDGTQNKIPQCTKWQVSKQNIKPPLVLLYIKEINYGRSSLYIFGSSNILNCFLLMSFPPIRNAVVVLASGFLLDKMGNTGELQCTEQAVSHTSTVLLILQIYDASVNISLSQSHLHMACGHAARKKDTCTPHSQYSYYFMNSFARAIYTVVPAF